MRLLPTENLPKILGEFGYRNPAHALDEVKRHSNSGARSVVPVISLRQASLSEALIDSIVSEMGDEASPAAIVWLCDWSIYYRYELRVFGSVIGHDLIDEGLPAFQAICWDSLDRDGVEQIKALFFVMMAFEFSGVILFRKPSTGICLNDGELFVATEDANVGEVLRVQLSN